MSADFAGFDAPQQNWSKLPHQIIDLLPSFETKAEIMVVLYILRHTWGYQENERRITLDEFENGRKKRDGTRIDAGIGMTRPSIVDGLERAQKHGFIEVAIETDDPARVKKFYSLKMKGLNFFTPDVKELNPSGKETLQRTEKDTKKDKELKTDTYVSTAVLPCDEQAAVFDGAITIKVKASKTQRSRDISSIIKIHIDTGVISRKGKSEYQNQTKRNDAIAILDAGITAQQVRDYVTHLKAQPFWKDKVISLDYIRSNIKAWVTAETQPVPATNNAPDYHKPIDLDDEIPPTYAAPSKELLGMLNTLMSINHLIGEEDQAS